mmetsp:Transcript_14439/g.43363  ORF Transcript_14439/g.43363 Transcript_14439/m.43363 type:complete len:230 (+) Transcript_14439:496-1185(+)
MSSSASSARGSGTSPTSRVRLSSAMSASLRFLEPSRPFMTRVSRTVPTSRGLSSAMSAWRSPAPFLTSSVSMCDSGLKDRPRGGEHAYSYESMDVCVLLCGVTPAVAVALSFFSPSAASATPSLAPYISCHRSTVVKLARSSSVMKTQPSMVATWKPGARGRFPPALAPKILTNFEKKKKSRASPRAPSRSPLHSLTRSLALPPRRAPLARAAPPCLTSPSRPARVLIE